jgi:hypothetical protein
MKAYPPREAYTSYLKSSLFGPVDGEFEEFEGTPFLKYMTGILFPKAAQVDIVGDQVGSAAEEGDGDEDEDTGVTNNSSVITLNNEMLPSSVGLSFYVDSNAVIKCDVRAALYQTIDKKKKRESQKWKRSPLNTDDDPGPCLISSKNHEKLVLNGVAKIVSRWRAQENGQSVVTIALINNLESLEKSLDPEKTLFQVGLICSVLEGKIKPYPNSEINFSNDPEGADLDFLYRNIRPFARGHGVAATWSDIDSKGNASWVAIDYAPTVDVPAATFEIKDSQIDPRYLDIDFIDGGNREEILIAFNSLYKSYERWIASHKMKPKDPILDKFISKAEVWLERIKLGIDLLKNDDVAWKAFHLANRAMAMQMVLTNSRPKKPYTKVLAKEPPLFDFKTLQGWRPFQIGFFLSTIESLTNNNSKYRDIVDVIWFPTGGGKTEAYLFISAFELIRRRLIYLDRDTGTAIFSRYTLRFLTTQQFQRTSALFIALELIRRKDQSLGAREFQLGLWVGEGVTPNKVRDAHDGFVEQLNSKSPINSFQLQACPYCGTEIFPSYEKKDGREWGMSEFGVESTPSSFKFRCINKKCDFHSGLPLNVIDQMLYANPPSMLLGTVDKFAMLPWDERARVFFGGVDDSSLPPSLIIQDELHLISGALGTIDAPYEAAIDTIIKLRGYDVKRIGSSATIRNAEEQVRGLYGTAYSVFPPPVGSWDDAYFFSTDLEKPGRRYIGLMAQGYVKPVVSMVWTAAAMLQGVVESNLPEEALNSYWTLLAYHNSRRELGRTLSAARDEIQTRMQVIAKSAKSVRKITEPFELSAQMVKKISEALEILEQEHSEVNPAIDFVPCTNIISVGVDVGRLGAMLVNSQPKLTSEYIQATSRVGRKNVPGVVVSLFSPVRPRDRSHYEDFRAYHESLYRFVEPTSVTPYALPARLRTLHAAMVAIVRHGLSIEWSVNDGAKKIDLQSPEFLNAMDLFKEKIKASDENEYLNVFNLLDQRIDEWSQFINSGVALLYDRKSAGHQFNSLLKTYGSSIAGSAWPTMMSVRNVDGETPISVS